MEHKKVVPPLGLYEHKFNTKLSKKLENIAEEINSDHQVDMRYID
jgi:hypothetical protein